jgi:hypothetical protein
MAHSKASADVVFTPAPEKKDIRFIKHNDAVYLRLEDVAAFVRDIGATEETDVRNRLNDAAINIEKIGK